jgi:hypothetical protein
VHTSIQRVGHRGSALRAHALRLGQVPIAGCARDALGAAPRLEQAGRRAFFGDLRIRFDCLVAAAPTASQVDPGEGTVACDWH